MQYRQKRILHFSKQNSTEKTGNITNDAVKRCGSAPAKAYITFKIWQKRISNNASNDAVLQRPNDAVLQRLIRLLEGGRMEEG